MFENIFTSLIDVPDSPGYPPPKSKRFILYPNRWPRENKLAAWAMALENTSGSPQPEPTWKETPTICLKLNLKIWITKLNIY